MKQRSVVPITRSCRFERYGPGLSDSDAGVGDFHRRRSSHRDPVWNPIAIHPSLIRMYSTDKFDSHKAT
jgi:hypothetical protein